MVECGNRCASIKPNPRTLRYLPRHRSLLLLLQGSFQVADALWIVMEYCGGGSVTDLLAKLSDTFNERLIAYIIAEALKVGCYWWQGALIGDMICGVDITAVDIQW